MWQVLESSKICPVIFNESGTIVFLIISLHLRNCCVTKSDGTYGCGTARKDGQGFPELLKNPKLKERYDTFFSWCG